MAAPDKQSREAEKALADPHWRLNNQYWVQDEDGQEVIFHMRPAQQMLWDEMWYLNVVLKSRQLGFSTEIVLYFLDTCIWNSNTSAGIIDRTIGDAKKKLEKALFAYRRLPEAVRGACPLTKESAEKLEWANGSSMEVGVSHRGGTLQLLHISEMGKIAAERPDRANEIKRGALNTVHPGQQIFIESTAEGVGGDFYETCERAKKLLLSGESLSKLDFRFHFFAWWQHEGYRLPLNFVLDREMVEYFAKLDTKYDIQLDDEQKAWYAKKLQQLNDNIDDMYREFPSIPEEAFWASVHGAYFSRQMTRMRQDGRLGHVPHDPSRPVNTFWDVGVDDNTSIWFHQTDGVRHRLIHYIEDSGFGVDHYISQLRILERPPKAEGGVEGGRGFTYGTHYGPHDLNKQQWGIPGAQTQKETAADAGIEFVVVPRIQSKMDAINASRAMLAMTWIDEEHCKRGIQCLDNYKKVWDEKRATWGKEPDHNWASHGADAHQCGACGLDTHTLTPPPPDRHSRSRPSAQPPSAWTS